MWTNEKEKNDTENWMHPIKVKCNVKILDEKSKYYSRLMSEILLIRSNNSTIYVNK